MTASCKLPERQHKAIQIWKNPILIVCGAICFHPGLVDQSVFLNNKNKCFHSCHLFFIFVSNKPGKNWVLNSINVGPFTVHKSTAPYRREQEAKHILLLDVVFKKPLLIKSWYISKTWEEQIDTSMVLKAYYTSVHAAHAAPWMMYPPHVLLVLCICPPLLLQFSRVLMEEPPLSR